jgi:hypothetical protein
MVFLLHSFAFQLVRLLPARVMVSSSALCIHLLHCFVFLGHAMERIQVAFLQLMIDCKSFF